MNQSGIKKHGYQVLFNKFKTLIQYDLIESHGVFDYIDSIKALMVKNSCVMLVNDACTLLDMIDEDVNVDSAVVASVFCLLTELAGVGVSLQLVIYSSRLIRRRFITAQLLWF